MQTNIQQRNLVRHLHADNAVEIFLIKTQQNGVFFSKVDRR